MVRISSNSDPTDDDLDLVVRFLRIVESLPEPVRPLPRPEFPALPSTGDTALDRLIADLGHENRHVVERAMAKLSKSGDLRVVPPLFALLTEHYSPYGLWGHWTLQRFGKAAASYIIERLTPLLRGEKYADYSTPSTIVHYGTWLLGDLRATEAVPMLLAAFDAPQLTHRWEVTLALGRIGDPRAFEPLLREFSQRSYEIHPITVALGALSDPRAFPPLIATLHL